jgi:hypothetical protein
MIITEQMLKTNFKSLLKRNLMTSVPDLNISLKTPSDASQKTVGLSNQQNELP